ncbi:hypothetical protein LCGC14_1230550 [marine sediment metagenome]|uniref:Phage terminase large subunit N-terminal domain-containing protein n=1 Tax=marine sediment metagenome TaxID=412755 RepID=A0A0F9NQV2_9ZZZZ
MAPRLQGMGHLPFQRNTDYFNEVCKQLDCDPATMMTKEEVYEALQYIPLPTILEVHKSRATHRIVVGGNRAGKSEGAAWEIVPYLFWRTRGWVVSANYELAEIIVDKVMTILIERAGMRRVKRPDNLRPFEFCYSSRDHRLTLWTEARLEAKSSENPDSMHGASLDYAVIDEASLFPYALYDTRLVPRLVDSGGWMLSLGTFEFLQGEWFENYYDIGQAPNDWSITSWRHPTRDNYHHYVSTGGETPQYLAIIFRTNWRKIVNMNPGVDWPLQPNEDIFIFNIDLIWLEKEKKRLEELSPGVFSARYEAQKSPNRYLVFPSWSVKTYVDKKRASFDKLLPVYLAVDPGGTYAVAAIQLKRFDDLDSFENKLSKGQHICIIDTIYLQTTVTTKEVFDECSKREWWANVARDIDYWDNFQGTIDVNAKEQQKTWRTLGRESTTLGRLYLRGKKVGIQDGIKTFQHYFDTHTFWSHPNNKFLHLELARHHYPEAPIKRQDTEDPRRTDNPKDSWNHLLKAIWYFMVGKFGCYGKSKRSGVVTRKELRKMARERKAVLKVREGMYAV